MTAYEVTAGPLTGNYRYTALTLKRQEVLVKGPKAEQSAYYAREGQKVGMKRVCSR